MKNKECFNDKENKGKHIKVYNFFIGSSKKAGNFEVITNCIMIHTKENFNVDRYISESLRLLSYLGMDAWRPCIHESKCSRRRSSVSSRDQRDRIDYKGESDDYRKRVREHIKDLSKTHALLWRRFRSILSERIKYQNGFKSTIRNNSTTPLKVTKKHALDCEESRAWMIASSNACSAWLSCE